MQLRDDKPGLSYANMWVLPGGRSNVGESIEATARRELREETGYVLSDLRWLVLLRDRPRNYPELTVTVFWTVYDALQPVECREGQELATILSSP